NGATAVGTFTLSYGDPNNDPIASGVLTTLTLPGGGTVKYTIGKTQSLVKDTVSWPDTALETTDAIAGPLAPTGPVCPPKHEFVPDSLGNAAAVTQRDAFDPVGSITTTTTWTRFDRVPGTVSGPPGTYPDAPGDGQNTRVVEVVEKVDGGSSRLTRYLFHLSDAGQNDPSISGTEI